MPTLWLQLTITNPVNWNVKEVKKDQQETAKEWDWLI